MPETDVRWRISLDGKLSVTWLSRFSAFSEDADVHLAWMTEDERGNSSGSVRMTQLDSLSLGKAYNITLVESEVGNIATTFNFVACK